MAQRRKKASPKPRSRSPQQTVESLRGALSRERALRKQASERETEALERERQALERQTATAEILGVISGTPTDTQPVFEAIVRRATKLCEAVYANVFRYDGDRLHWVASDGSPPELLSALGGAYPAKPDRSWVVGRVALEAQAVHVEDTRSDPDYDRDLAARLRYRRVLGVPLLRAGEVVGVITVGWAEAGPIQPRHEELLRTFADQAAIAIENVRLFNETKEALEQQTATSEVLRVIAGTPADAQPVFDAIAQSAARVFNAPHAGVALVEGDVLRLRATAGRLEPRGQPLVPFDRTSTSGSALLDMNIVDVPDTEAADAPAFSRDGGRLVGYRAIAGAPMLRDGKGIGVITVMRANPGALTGKQRQLLQTFADQAVIAIENARLFNETKEALERQTATGEILASMSGSMTDTKPVFDAIVRNVLRLFGSNYAAVLLRRDQVFELAGFKGEPGFERLQEAFPSPLDEHTISGEVVMARQVRRYTPIAGNLAVPRRTAEFAGRFGFNSIMAAPMMWKGEAIGAIVTSRRQPLPFDDKQVALIQSFAAQAVIAIENVRLFNETKEALERQTATAEILKVISKSPSNIQPVFDAVAESAARLCDATDVLIRRIEGDVLRAVAHIGSIPLPAEVAAMPVSPKNVAGRAVIERRTIHIHDVTEDSMRDEYPEAAFMAQRGTGYRTLLVVPLVRNDVAMGLIAVRREERHPFSDEQIGLLQTFADQAVIAIENVRLFNETKEALEQQKASADVLSVISSSIADTKPVFDRIVGSCERLFAGKLVGINLVSDDGLIRVGAYHGRGREEFEKVFPLPLDRNSGTGLAVLERRVLHYPDAADAGVPDGVRRGCATTGIMACIFAPLLWEGRGLGAIFVGRDHVGEFSDKEIALLRTFADQAAIAIQNARLFKELQERTDALTKSVDQLTALGEVGQAISSTLDLDKVLKTIVSRAVQLAGLDGGSIYEFDDRDEGFHLRAAEHVEEEILEVSRRSPIRLAEGAVGRAGATREPVVVEDVLDESYQSRVRELLIKSGSRALLAVPLLREDLLLGALVVSRNSPGPFAPEVIDLLKTFATQSAVAIQNARLFNETNEALEQQKASAEVLGAISSSIADTRPVFDKILESCERLFEGHLVGVTLVTPDGKIELGGYHGPDYEKLKSVYPLPLSQESGSGMAILKGVVGQYPDSEASGVPAGVTAGCKTVGMRSIVFAPMLFEGRGIGAIWVGRKYTGAFSDKQIGLLKTFADQAVIAIQNARLFREIQEKSAQLEVANKHKSDFLANMSHELRTPLNAIIGFSEALIDRLFGDLTDKQLEYQKDIHQSGKHLLSLINDILDLSKIEAGRMELELSSFHLPTAISNAITLIRERAMRHGIALGVQIDERLGELQADERKLKQVLLNLLSNAVKFTPDGGRVEVSAKLDTDKVEIAVKDTGVGISPEDQASLFEEFKQFGKDRSRKAEGTGLGLSLTKRLVELHGGQILVESMVGHGSTFRVMLPLTHDRVIE